MRLPPHHHERTAGGTDLVAVDWAGADLTELRLVLPVLRTDPRTAVLAHLLGRLLPLGPTDAGFAAHDERMLEHGAGVSSGGGVDRVTVSATVPPDQLRWALEDLVGRVLAPAFTPTAVAEAVRAERTRLTRAAAHRETEVHRVLARSRWGPGHPYAHPLPTAEDLARLEEDGELDPDALARSAHARLTLDGATVVVVGDLGTDGGRRWPDAVGPLRDVLDTAGPGAPAPPAPGDPGPRQVPRLLVPVGDDEVTASVRLWSPAPQRQHPDHPALLQFGMVLGGYFGSRLNQELRERRGDVYGVSTGFEVLATAATFVLMLECPVDRLDAVHATVLDTVADLRRDGPGEDELRAAVRYSTNAVTVGMATPAALAGAGASVVFGGDTLDLWARQAGIAATLRPAEVAAAGERHLSPSALIDLVAAPAAAVTGTDVRRPDEVEGSSA
ncbi:M16 family metallopeptidase [Modestobacter italicus]|uniref:M16 family metallopeptidase n=1 Tax=Modestobacter italicus (strain DSM 44449 / CECT 9708 / BC 501) TaxID=2732864 RepID=UPI001C95CD3E|nr:insulinase family protein [Modestobacter italicus]